jgi:hypothetical protein
MGQSRITRRGEAYVAHLRRRRLLAWVVEVNGLHLRHLLARVVEPHRLCCLRNLVCARALDAKIHAIARHDGIPRVVHVHALACIVVGVRNSTSHSVAHGSGPRHRRVVVIRRLAVVCLRGRHFSTKCTAIKEDFVNEDSVFVKEYNY